MQQLLRSESAEVVRLDLADWRNAVQTHRKWTYFVGCNDTVKIGTAFNPLKRVSDMQVGNPYELELIAVTEEPERDCHIRFYSRWIRGEWFRERDEIENILEKQWLEKYGCNRPVTITEIAEAASISERKARKVVEETGFLRDNQTEGRYDFLIDTLCTAPRGLLLFKRRAQWTQ